MQMGALNASMVFREMISVLKQECKSELEHQNVRDCESVVIMYVIVF